jgi:DNA-directed RNA polymerase specialized sigma24 family protein
MGLPARTRLPPAEQKRTRRLTGWQSGHSLLGADFRPSLGVCGEIRRHATVRQQLIRGARACGPGDRAAFEALYQATSLKLYGIVVRILGRRRSGGRSLARSLTCECGRAQATMTPRRSSPITWLATIARNRALDEAKRKTMVSLEERPAPTATTRLTTTQRQLRGDGGEDPATVRLSQYALDRKRRR